MSDITIHFVSATGETTPIQARTGQSLMLAAVEANVKGIDADCGGTITCATCHVMVGTPWLERLPAVSPDEDSVLDFTASPRTAGSRLCCQIELTPELDGLTVALPPTQY